LFGGGSLFKAYLWLMINGAFSCGARPQVRAFNAGAERMFGWKEEEIVGKELSMLMPSNTARQHQLYIDRYLRSGEHAQGRVVGTNRKVCATLHARQST
jgi:PAS domain S-box-containing protein